MNRVPCWSGLQLAGLIVLFEILLPWNPVLADDGPPPIPEAALVRFYEATGGEEWTRNDGWLDPSVSVCDWYGLECGLEPGFLFLSEINLSNNNLRGSINESGILGISLDRLDLSNNKLYGTLPALPLVADVLDLSGNELTGRLPQVRAVPPDGAIVLGNILPQSLRVLDLADNHFEGSIPGDWAEAFTLRYLGLANNALDSGMERAFLAMDTSEPGELRLEGNRMSGLIPGFFPDANLFLTDETSAGGGLNLCWNDLQLADPDLINFISRRHVAGTSWQQCVSRNRIEIDATVSGSWFSPQRAGEGLSLLLLENGQPLVYSFTYDPRGRQQWFFEVGRRDDLFLDWPNLLETRGNFGSGLRLLDGQPALRSTARLRLDRLSDGEMLMERVYFDYSDCPSFNVGGAIGGNDPIPCRFSPSSDRIEQIQLSRLAGSRCDNQQPQQWISGAWFDPSRTGEGFVVEVIEDGRGVVYWFTYSAGGSDRQAWFTADGSFDGNTLHIENLLQPIGARSGTGFDASQLELRNWGRLTLEFNENDQGLARYQSNDPEFGSGEFPLQRLARPMLAECDN
jgi:hypothetical protein